MSVEVYQVGQAILTIAGVIEVKDWVSLQREDISETEFDIEVGINGESFTDISRTDQARITIELLQTSSAVKTMVSLYSLQKVGVIGIPLLFTNQIETVFYPVAFLAKQPTKSDRAEGQNVQVIINATNQFAVPVSISEEQTELLNRIS